MLLGALLLRPIHDVDIFWQLKLGELVLDHGALVTTEPFAASHLGEPLAQLAWLGQIVLAAVRRIGGWPSLQLFDALLWLGGFCAAGWAVRRSMAAPAGVVAAVMLAFPFALPYSSLRPQSFAVLGFGLLIALLTAQLRWQAKLLLGAVLLVLWQNLHPSVAVALVYLGVRAGWGWLMLMARRRDQPPWLDSALAMCAALAVFATPMGTDLIAIAAHNAAASTAMLVDEWQSVWSPANTRLLPTLIPVPLLFLSLLVMLRDKLDWEWLLPSLALLAASALAVRFSPFWAISAIPVLAPLLTRQTEPDPAAGRECAGAAIGLGLAAVLALAFHQPRFAEWLPLKGVAALQAEQVHGTVFAELPWGGPLIDGGYPDWQVALDGRYYVYSDAELATARTVGAEPSALLQIERIWAPSALLLDPEVSGNLIHQLRGQPHAWREIQTGDFSVAFVRVKPVPAAAGR